ncbi:nesprin-2-like [Heptranchias perlo]|uniref:nesprin-2-like n=1 Tax=Heptranchias perlo TaxID=212740 RepID=UPI003559489B
MNGIGDWLQEVTTQLENTGLKRNGGSEKGLEELRDAVSAQRQAMAEVSGQLQNRYSERYTTIPTDTATRIQETSRALGDMEGKVGALGSQNARSQELSCRIGATKTGLHNIEEILQQRSKSDSEAQTQQKRIWREIDEWHSVLSQLDAEVQDVAEQDPEVGQELMESLMEPFQQHQRVSWLAEQRTTLLNKIPECLEEYKQITDSVMSWIRSTEALLSSETDYSTAKSLGKQHFAFQMAAESGRQKENGLQDIASRLKELSAMYQTDEMMQRVSELGEGGSAIRQAVAGKLDEMENIATELGDIESEVKTLESKVSKINTILSSVDLCDLPVPEHLENRQIILENLEEMKDLVGVMEEWKKSLGLPEEAVCAFEVFTKVARVTDELTHLQEVTTQQSTVLQSLLEKLQEYDTEIERIQKEDEFSIEAQGKRLADLSERRELLLNNTQEALTELVQEEPACEQPVDEGCTEEEQSPSAHINQPRDSKVTQSMVLTDGKLSSLMEEDEDAVESAERSPTPVPPLDPCPSTLEHLHVCRARAADLELWLETACERLRADGRDQEAMQRDVEQQLLQSQSMLLEIEQKVCELAHARHEGNAAVRPELEQLSLRLGTLKGSLVTFQAKLQDVQSEEQGARSKEIAPTDGLVCLQPSGGRGILPATKPRLTRQDSLQQQKELEVELTEHRQLTEYIALHGEKMWHGEQQGPSPCSSRDPGDPLLLREAMPADPGAPGKVPSPGDRAALNWRHLQRETAGRLRLLEDSLRQGLGSQVRVVAGTPRGAQGISSDPPGGEELNVWVTRLGELGHEAAAVTTQGEGEFNEEARLELENGLQNAALRISHWLDAAEERMASDRTVPIEGAEQQVHHHQLQAETMERVCREVGEQRSLLEQSWVLDAQDRPVAIDCLASLQSRLKLLQSAHTTMIESLRAGEREVTEYQLRLRQLEAVLLERRTDIQQGLLESGGHSTGEQLQLIEEMERELGPLEEQLLAVIEEGERCELKPTVRHDIYKLEEVLDGTWACLRGRRVELRGGLAVGSRYECLLQGLTGLIDSGREMVVQDSIHPTKTIRELQSHLQSYKLFFRRLDNHIVLAEKVSQNVPESLVARHRDLWQELVKEEAVLQSQALLHGVQMETTLQAWTEFEEEHLVLTKTMEMLSSTVPAVGLVEETEERLAERIVTFQRIRSSLDANQPRMDQALRNGKALLLSVSSPELEARPSSLEEGWLSLRNQVNHELHRLETLFKFWTRFQRESHEVSQWLESAGSSLRYWAQESVSLPPNPETVGNQLTHFLDFWKEVDGRSWSKRSVVSSGHQLLQLKQTEAGALRAWLTQLEQDWAQLLAQLPSIQEELHQLQMERLPSRQAITELSAWIHSVDMAIRENEAGTRAPSGSTGVTLVLQKYKDYKMEMSCQQLTVDFVNQSVLQISSQDMQSDRDKKRDFAESLGALNLEWERLSRDLSVRMLHLESLLESWTEYEGRVQLLGSWLEAQGESLRKSRKACSHTAVFSALTDCQELTERLKVKEPELERLRRAVPLASEMPINVTEKLDQLHESWRSLDAEANQLRATLTSRLQLWTTYQESYEQVNGEVLKARYTLEHCTPLSSSLEAVRVQVQSLQTLQDTAACGEEIWRKFKEASQRLREECCPPVTLQLETKCEVIHCRWTCVNQDITEQLRSARVQSQLWQHYRDVYCSTLAEVQRSEQGCEHLLAEISAEDSNQERLQSRLVEIQESLSDLRTLQEDISRVCEAADKLARQVDSSSSATIQSDSRCLSGKVSRLEELLSLKIPDIQGLMEQHEDFSRYLHTLETLVNESEEVLKSVNSGTAGAEQDRMETLKDHLLKLSSSSLLLETLNHLSNGLLLSDPDYRRVQTLNRRWGQARATAADRCSELQTAVLQKENFAQKCERWRRFLEKVEEGLMVDVAGSYEGLRKQQETHELFQAEASIAHQILDSVVSEALSLLPRGEVQDRSVFALNLSALEERWRGLARRVRQRQSTVHALADQWRCHSDAAAKLRKLLTNTSNQLRVADGPSCYGLRQLWGLVEDVKHRERGLHRQHSRYALTQAVGRELLAAADAQTKPSLEGQLRQLQEAWESANSQLKDKRNELSNVEKMCDRCGEQVTALGFKLQEFRADVKRALPSSSEDLQRDQSKLQELRGPLQDWSNSLAELSSMKVDLSKHLVPDEAVGFQEQIEHLESQWEQLRLMVSLRTLKISDQLDQWAVFNTKSKRLGDWLKQMEDRVSHITDSSEEMIDRLQKDCMEEIKLCDENKVQLKQLGDKLIKASSTLKASEIDNKLHLINSRWQHLLEVIEARVKKLKDTLCSVQLLNREMSSLRTWLSRIESELSKPVVYNICDDQEIEKKLAEQQELQRDIEQHSVGVSSVLNLCDSLLSDTDTETECNSIQQTTRSLDSRWRNICAMSVERRMRIEETWRLWQKFLDDYSRFEDWLKGAERTAAQPNSSQVLYTVAKEELKKFETFQRQIHESLTQLELINKQYRRLARENRTDSSSRLKQMVHEGNQRWDSLQKRITAILRRLKHFTNQREEFESSRDGILVWLTEMDLQLTNVEHFSESDINDKVRQLNAFQQEITLNTNKIDQLIVSGEQLIQKIEPMDATVIEDELEELHGYCQEVFGRVARFHQRLISKRPVFDEDKDLSDREADTDDGGSLPNMSWQEKAGGPELSAQQPFCQLTPPGTSQRHERSGRDTPVSVDSIPLEWDHTVDVGGSSSHEDEEEGMYFSTLSGTDQ